jgi:hypothetical protein
VMVSRKLEDETKVEDASVLYLAVNEDKTRSPVAMESDGSEGKDERL